MDIWIVEYRYSENGFWKHYCDVEFSRREFATACAKEIMNNIHLQSVRVSKVEKVDLQWKVTKSFPCKIVEPQKINWKEEGF